MAAFHRLRRARRPDDDGRRPDVRPVLAKLAGGTARDLARTTQTARHAGGPEGAAPSARTEVRGALADGVRRGRPERAALVEPARRPGRQSADPGARGRRGGPRAGRGAMEGVA